MLITKLLWDELLEPITRLVPILQRDPAPVTSTLLLEESSNPMNPRPAYTLAPLEMVRLFKVLPPKGTKGRWRPPPPIARESALLHVELIPVTSTELLEADDPTPIAA